MDYISEAEALSDIYEGCEIYSEPYTNEDKAEYGEIVSNQLKIII